LQSIVQQVFSKIVGFSSLYWALKRQKFRVANDPVIRTNRCNRFQRTEYLPLFPYKTEQTLILDLNLVRSRFLEKHLAHV
jgi:hypothetical protein